MARALRTPQFAAISLTYFACCAAHSGPIFHMVSYAIDCGVPAMAAATVFGAAGVASSSGRVIGGLAADRIGAKRMIVFGLALQAVSVSLYVFTRDLASFYGLALMFGFSYGAVMPLYAILVREYFGARIMGTMFGAVNMASTLGHGDRPVGRRLALRRLRQLFLALYRLVRHRPRRRRDRLHLPPAPRAFGRAAGPERHAKRVAHAPHRAPTPSLAQDLPKIPICSDPSRRPRVALMRRSMSWANASRSSSPIVMDVSTMRFEPSSTDTGASSSAARSVLLLSVDVTIADGEDFNLLDPGRGAKLDDIALTCLHECSGYW